jgi:hypothetical protein
MMAAWDVTAQPRQVGDQAVALRKEVQLGKL